MEMWNPVMLIFQERRHFLPAVLACNQPLWGCDDIFRETQILEAAHRRVYQSE